VKYTSLGVIFIVNERWSQRPTTIASDVNENENYGYTALIAASLEIATKKGEQGITTYGRRLFSLASQNKERLFPCSLAHAQPCSRPALLTSSLAQL
jgi:hypothetical protein